jgi:hypothetical protein
MLIKVWVCPTEGCGSYYASSSQEHLDLSKELRQGRVEDRDRSGARLVKGVRADCPNCKAERIPLTLDVVIPAATPVAA